MLGFKDWAEGRVYFVGLNWVFHSVLAHDEAATRLLDGFFEQAKPFGEIALPDFPVSLLRQPGDNWGFTYQADEDTHVLIAETWSPHWRVTVDGQASTAYNHQNLISLLLPAGKHEVEFQYTSTWIQWVGWGVTILFIVLVLAVWLAYPRQDADFQAEHFIRSLKTFASGLFLKLFDDE